MITTLRIRKDYSEMELAIKWYSIISTLNNFKWAPLEIKLLAYTAIKGDISSGGKRVAFCQLYNISKNSLGNVIWKLTKKFYLLRVDGKIKVHPDLMMNFENDIVLQLNLFHGSSQ